MWCRKACLLKLKGNKANKNNINKPKQYWDDIHIKLYPATFKMKTKLSKVNH